MHWHVAADDNRPTAGQSQAVKVIVDIGQVRLDVHVSMLSGPFTFELLPAQRQGMVRARGRAGGDPESLVVVPLRKAHRELRQRVPALRVVLDPGRQEVSEQELLGFDEPGME